MRFRIVIPVFLVLFALMKSGCADPSLEVTTPPAGDTTTMVLACSPSAEITISGRDVFYQISGMDAKQLRTQMNQHGREDSFGHHWDAYTDWQVTWTYPYVEDDESCSLGAIDMVVEIVYTYPKWDVPEDAAQELIEAWDAYLLALREHEHGHRELAIAAACDVLRELNSFPTFNSCVDLEREADAAAEHILEDYSQQELNYDRTTEHGLTQGVIFP